MQIDVKTQEINIDQAHAYALALEYTPINTTIFMLNTALNLIFPPRCLLCYEPTAAAGSLCLECWQGLRFIEAPQCVQCGHPFEYEVADNTHCPECLSNPPPFDRARSVLRYDDASRKLLTRFKFSDALHSLPSLTQWAARAGAECLEHADIIIPVPLHRLRLFKRRYNQAALIAKALGKYKKIPYLLTALKRTKRTTPQTGLSKRQRLLNVRGAFIVNPQHLPNIKDQRIVLIDDVMTTGATLHSCCKALKKAGAKEINVLTIARTLKDLS